MSSNFKLFQFFDISMRMSSLKRYSQTHLMKEESVLEHTGFVCLMCYFIGLHLKREGININMGPLLSKAVVHDMDEIITGDIPRPTKYSQGVLGAIREIEAENMEKIATELKLPELYYDWENAKDTGEMEGYIVSLCDSYAVLYKGYQEVVMFGNKLMLNNLTTIKKNIYRKLSLIQECLEYESGFIQILSANTDAMLEEIENKCR